MENHNIVWVGMDTDAKKNQIALYRGWEEEPAAEWEAGMDAKGRCSPFFGQKTGFFKVESGP